VQTILAIYGAALSTFLAALTWVKFVKEKPRISVKATPIFFSATEHADTHGVLVNVQRGDDTVLEEADIEFRVRNAGSQACQINSVFVETTEWIHQITPIGLPIVLPPNTGCAVRIQPEYFAPKNISTDGKLSDMGVLSAGVIDVLERKHLLSGKNLRIVTSQCQELPLRTAAYRHKESGRFVTAFQVKDAATLISKKNSLE
jgi:hypothetical protein